LEISIRDKVVYSLWLVPLVLPFGMALWDLYVLASSMARNIGGAPLPMVLRLDAELIGIGSLVPVAFCIAWLLTRRREDRTSFFIVLVAYMVLTCGFALANRSQKQNYGLAVLVLLAMCVGIIVSVVFALLRRKRVVARAVLYHSPDQRETRLQKEQAMGYAQTALGKKVLYSLWLLPLAVSLLVALPPAFDVVSTLVFTRSTIGLYDRPALGVSVRAAGLLVVVGYLFGWLTSREREERTLVIVSAFAYAALTAITILLATMRMWGVYFFACVIGTALVIAACVWAITRRKEVVGRAVSHRSSKQRELRKLEERRLLASEKAAMSNSRGRQVRKASTWSRSKKRTLEASHIAPAPETKPAPETNGAPGSALAAVVGFNRRASTKEAEVVPTVPTSAGDVPIQPTRPMEAEVAPTFVGDAPMQPTRPMEEEVVSVSPPLSEPKPGRVAAEKHPRPSQRATSAKEAVPPANAEQIDVNSCTATELLSLPGMTTTIARSIVSNREAGGPYASVEQLVARNGLKPHEVAPFLLKLTASAPSSERVGTRRARMLDL